MALEPGPAPQLGRFLFFYSLWGCTFYFNSHFVGQVALELGPAPDVAFFFFIRAEIEKFTKRVAVRAVELSTGAFCTEFRCEQLCDDVIFSDRGQFFDFSRKGLP